MFRSRQFIIGIVISVVFLGFAISQEDPALLWKEILKANYWFFLPALALYFAGVWVRAVRWRTLLKPISPKLSLNETFSIVVIGYMANDVLPARLGELVRAYVLNKQQGVKKTTALATIFVERVFDGLTMVGFAAAVVLFLITVDRAALATGTQNNSEHKLGSLISQLSLPIAITSVAFLGLLVVFVAVASSRQRVERLVGFGLKFLPGRLHERGEKLADAFVDGLGSLRSPSSLGIVFVTSIVAWLLETGMYYLIGNFAFSLTAHGLPLPFYVYMLVTALVNLSTLIPQAPGFIGVFEWVAKVVLVGAFGVLSDAATSYVFLLHAALLIPVSLLGFFYLAKESLSWGELTNLEKSRAQAAESAHELEGPLTDIEQSQDGSGPSPGESSEGPRGSVKENIKREVK